VVVGWYWLEVLAAVWGFSRHAATVISGHPI